MGSKQLSSLIIRGLSSNALIRVANVVLGMVLSVMLARVLGAEEYGLYAFVISLITLIGLPLRGGLPTLITREVAKYHFEEDWSKIKGIILTALIFLVVVSVLLSVCLKWGVHSSLLDVTPANRSAYDAGAIALPFVVLLLFLGGVLKGFRRVVLASFSEQLIQPLLFLMFLLLFVNQDNQFSAVDSLWFYLFSFLAACLFSALFVSLVLPESFWRVLPSYDLRVWTKSFFPLAGFSALSIANSQMDLVLLGVLSSSEDVGLFRVSMQVAIIVSLGLTVVNSVISPHVVRLIQANQEADLQKILFFSALVSTMLAAAVFVFIFVWGRELLSGFFGVGFEKAYLALVIMSVGQVVNCICGSVSLVLNMAGHEMETLKGIGVALCSNVLVALLSIPYLGSVGAALAASIAQIIWNLLLVQKARRLVNINTTVINFKYL